VNRYEVTQFNALGAMVEILMRQPQTKSEMNNPTRLCYTAPAPSRDRHLEIERRFRLRLIIGYGLSESPFGTVWPVDGASTPYESMGKPRQHPRASVRVNEARVINMHGETVKVGESGELLLRNPAIMTGYLDDPEGTALVLRDGWLHTGDLVRSDEDGWLYFVARQKEVIRRRGENISPVEVEDVLLSHEAVLDAAAIAVPSDLSEDDVKAFIVLRPGFAATAAELHVWCAKNLASFKVPRYIEFIDALPFTPTGRIARHQLLRERVASETDFAVTTSCPPR
jgi:crotonobetaine/carnitine-CoA ligase